MGNFGLAFPKALEVTYPSWSGMLATKAVDTTPSDVSAHLHGDDSIGILGCYAAVDSFTHPYLSAAVATAVNRWMQDKYLDADARLRGSIVVPVHYPDLAIAEIKRAAADPRFVQVIVPARAAAGYGQQRFWPIWRAATEHGLTIAITQGGGSGSPPTTVGWPSTVFETYATANTFFHGHIVSIVLGGVLQELTDVRFAILESGVSYLPSLKWRLDENWKSYRREVPWVSKLPSTYIEQHFGFTASPFDGPDEPAQRTELVAAIGTDSLMYGSDFPHQYGGNGIDNVLTPEARGAYYKGNALRFYPGLR
jgi:predicted TIM-barrel fold metal-dependent hydrolase